MESAHIVLPVEAVLPWHKGHNYQQSSLRDVPIRIWGAAENVQTPATGQRAAPRSEALSR